MNKKGFTLIELLTVIVLLSLLMGIAIPGISKISANAKKKSLNTKIKLIESAATYWGQDNKTLLKSGICEIEGVSYSCTKIKISKLIEDDYLDEDSNTTNLEQKCVYIYKKNNRVYSYYNEDDIDCKNQVVDLEAPKNTNYPAECDSECENQVVDLEAPKITNYSVEYDLSSNIATIKNGSATDNNKIKEYRFTESKNSTDNWIANDTNAIENISYSLSESKNTIIYFQVKDEANNIQSHEIQISNCIPSYYDLQKTSRTSPYYGGSYLECKFTFRMNIIGQRKINYKSCYNDSWSNFSLEDNNNHTLTFKTDIANCGNECYFNVKTLYKDINDDSHEVECYNRIK